jgi:hypothetical protein
MSVHFYHNSSIKIIKELANLIKINFKNTINNKIIIFEHFNNNTKKKWKKYHHQVNNLSKSIKTKDNQYQKKRKLILKF